MQWTNRHNLPEPLVAAITTDDHVTKGDYSVTECCSPIQQSVLRKRHDDEIVEDVADHLWVLLGHAIHYVIEKFSRKIDPSKGFRMLEETLTIKLENGVVVSGTLDHYDGTKRMIDDWKVTNIYKVTNGDTSDWKRQLQIYQALVVGAGYPVSKIVNQAICRDWMRRDTVKPGYPKIPFVSIEQPLQDVDITRAWLLERTDQLRDAKELDNYELADRYPCSREDMWAAPDGWAVCKGDSTRAVPKGIHSNEVDAKKMADEKGPGYSVIHRPGFRRRCAEYCTPSEFCIQWREHQKKHTTVKEASEA